MALAFDAVAHAELLPGTGPLNFNHTCTGSNLVLLVGIESTQAVTGVTYNSVTMTQLSSANDGAGANYYIYGLLAPATGINQVSISYSGSSNIRVTSASYTGVKQSGLPDATKTKTSAASIASMSDTITVVGNPCWICLFFYGGGSPTTTFGADTTSRFNGTASDQAFWGDSNAGKSSGGYTMTLNFSPNSTANQGFMMVSIADANQILATITGGSFAFFM